MLKVLLPVDGSKSAAGATHKLVETLSGTGSRPKSICSRFICRCHGS